MTERTLDQTPNTAEQGAEPGPPAASTSSEAPADLLDEGADGADDASLDDAGEDDAADPGEGDDAAPAADAEADDADPEPTEGADAKEPLSYTRPEDPEALTAWRETIADVFGESDDAAESFVENVAGKLPPEQVEAIGAWYKERQAAQASADVSAAKDARALLSKSWGAESFNTHRANVKTWLKSLPDGMADLITDARLGDGHRALNNPQFFALLASLAQASQPAGSRVEQIKKIMTTDIGRYHKEGLDKEYLALTAEKPSTKTAASNSETPTVSARELEIARIRDTDINRYFREGLDREIVRIRESKSATEKRKGP